jgi:hypothetical protein
VVCVGRGWARGGSVVGKLKKSCREDVRTSLWKGGDEVVARGGE